MTEYSRIAKGSFTAEGTAMLASSRFINLPFQPDFVELWNYTNIAAGAAASKVCRAWWDASLIVSSNNPTMIELYTAGSVTAFDTIVTGGISPFADTSVFNSDAAKQVVAITKANPAQVTVTAHGYNVGDIVGFSGLYQTSTTGMPQITDLYFTVNTVVDANNFTIKWNTNQSNYTALSASPTGAFVARVTGAGIYQPYFNVISAITTGATTSITCTTYHNFEVGQEIGFRIPAAWGTTQLNELPNTLVPGSPKYYYVTSITDNFTFVCNANTVGATAFNSNQTVASVPGLQIPQVVPVGDVNTGGNIITATSPLYPPPSFPTFSNRIPTINGPAIRGAFVNNSAQGFYIGTGVGTNDTSAFIMTTGDVVAWRAYLHDYSSP